MHHYRQALLHMRQGDSDRDIAAACVMGRPKAALWRSIATERGWLDVALPLPDDEAIAAGLGNPRKASTTISTLEPHRSAVAAWVEQGVSGTAIHAALQRQHGFTVRYSAVRRLVADGRAVLPGAEPARPGHQIGASKAFKIHPGVTPRDARFTHIHCGTSMPSADGGVHPIAYRLRP